MTVGQLVDELLKFNRDITVITYDRDVIKEVFLQNKLDLSTAPFDANRYQVMIK